MAGTLNDVIRRVATLVNGPPVAVMPGSEPQARRQFTDPQIKEFVNTAYSDCYLVLAERHVLALRAQADVNAVPANTTSMTLTSVPALPANLVEPIEMWEQIPGASFWTTMRKVTDHLPMNATQANLNGLWKWENQTLYLPGATGTVNLRFAYIFKLTEFSLPSDTVAIPDLVNPLAYFAASLALNGNDFYEKKGFDSLYRISGMDSHVKQQTPNYRQLRRWGRPRRR